MPKIENKIHKYLQSGRSWYQRPLEDIKVFTIHHSAMKQDGRQTNDSVLEAIKRVHVGQGWPGLAYHFVIMPDGTIYQTNDFSDITWHDTINDDSVGILVHGYFHPSVNEVPTQAQLKSLKELLDDLSTNHPEFPADQDDVVGHRERSATACPGDNLIKYVVEYREKKGQVNWIATSNKCEDSLAKMTESYKEWKEKARAKDGIIKERDKTIKEKDEQYKKLKDLMESALKEDQDIRNEAVKNTKEQYDSLVSELRLEVKRLSSQDFTFNEVLRICKNYIKKVVQICKNYIKKAYESKKLI